MTQEEKQLLLKDLCARLPYGVKVNIKAKKKSYIATVCEITRNYICIEGGGETYFSHDSYKPYLRPTLSMTEEEREIYTKLEINIKNSEGILFIANCNLLQRFFTSHHLDNNHLIESGLALEAPEEMYVL